MHLIAWNHELDEFKWKWIEWNETTLACSGCKPVSAMVWSNKAQDTNSADKRSVKKYIDIPFELRPSSSASFPSYFSIACSLPTVGEEGIIKLLPITVCLSLHKQTSLHLTSAEVRDICMHMQKHICGNINVRHRCVLDTDQCSNAFTV